MKTAFTFVILILLSNSNFAFAVTSSFAADTEKLIRQRIAAEELDRIRHEAITAANLLATPSNNCNDRTALERKACFHIALINQALAKLNRSIEIQTADSFCTDGSGDKGTAKDELSHFGLNQPIIRDQQHHTGQ